VSSYGLAEAEADDQASSAQQRVPDRATWVTRHAGAASRSTSKTPGAGCRTRCSSWSGSTRRT